MNNNNVWFVTGASKGIGRSLVKKLLQQGFKVAATSRKKEDLTEAIGDHDSFLPLKVDITSGKEVKEAVAQTIEKFGAINVVVNNAGYGQLGSLEELTDAEARENFNVNVFGTLHVIREIMPFLRKQGSGHIFNISSIGGFFGNFPGWGIYCATKFAVNGLTESLAEEVKPFGIKATVVEPGYFRTSFLASGSLATPANEIAAYKAVRDSQEMHQNLNGSQAGDPEKAAQALITVAGQEEAPLHLFLGQDAYNMAQLKIQSLQENIEKWKEITVSTGFEEA